MMTFATSCLRALLVSALLLAAGRAALAGRDVNLYEQTIGDEQEQYYPDTRYRTAAFTFEDPHKTGLGDPISILLSKKLLFSSRVSSFSVVNYLQGAGPDSSRNLAYFDLVDAITKDQGFLLALWGHLSETEDGVRIDSFLQVPSDVGGASSIRSIRLPKGMGGGTLTARLKLDRVWLQSLDVELGQASLLRAAADEVVTLRSEPSISANAVGLIPRGQPYRIIRKEDPWAYLEFDDDVDGWTSVDAFCEDFCRQLMDVAIFANDVVLVSTGGARRPVPQSLTDNKAPQAMLDQVAALVALPDDPRKAVEIAEPWADDPLPVGAGFANLLAVARVAAELERVRAKEPEFDSIRLDRKFVEGIAQQLAEASVADPGDLDVVENLAVLFAYLGDEKRRSLALEIAATLKAR